MSHWSSSRPLASGTLSNLSPQPGLLSDILLSWVMEIRGHGDLQGWLLYTIQHVIGRVDAGVAQRSPWIWAWVDLSW